MLDDSMSGRSVVDDQNTKSESELVDEDDDFNIVMSKHECGAAFMADGFTRTSGQISLAVATSGPGATNLLTGAGVAFDDGIPIVIVTGQVSTASMGKGVSQESTSENIDIVSMFAPVTKYSVMITRADRIAHHFQTAMRLATSGKPGPVHLNIPTDLWHVPVKHKLANPRHYRPVQSSIDIDQTTRAATMLSQSKYPVILAGSGANTPAARNWLVKLAEQLNVPVATTPKAKGVFPEDHHMSLGVFGFAGHRQAADIILDSRVDSETQTNNWDSRLAEDRCLIHLDIDYSIIGRNYPTELALVGDAATTLEYLVGLSADQRPGAVWDHSHPDKTDDSFYNEPDLRASGNIPVTPQRWRKELSQLLPDNAMVFSDIGGHMLFNIHDLYLTGDQRFVLNLGFGSMGHGTVAPIGAAMANPENVVFAIVGDGCFTMNGMEVLTALLIGKGLDCLGRQKPLSIASLAQAMGIGASTVSAPGELASAIEQAVQSREPYVIEVFSDPGISPPLQDRAKTISGFKA